MKLFFKSTLDFLFAGFKENLNIPKLEKILKVGLEIILFNNSKNSNDPRFVNS